MNRCFYQNKAELQKKIAKIKADGASKLHVISDFDSTITKRFIDGKKLPSSFSLIRDGNYLGEEFSKEDYAGFDRYRPIETDLTLSKELRAKNMSDWWEWHVQLMVEHGMKKSVVDDIVKKYHAVFREKSVDLFKIIEKHKLPFLIFSAGIADILIGFLKHYDMFTDNVKVIANYFKYDDEGNVLGYAGKTITSHNKNETSVDRQEIKDRTNLILIGDALEDIHMAEGLKHDTVIKIAFLNNHVEKLKDVYLENFDIVIPNDGTMDEVLNLFKEILE